MSEDLVREPAALESRNLIIGWAKETANGGVNRLPQALGIAARDGIGLGWVKAIFATAVEEAKAKKAWVAPASKTELTPKAEPLPPVTRTRSVALKAAPKPENELAPAAVPSTPSTPKAEPEPTLKAGPENEPAKAKAENALPKALPAITRTRSLVPAPQVLPEVAEETEEEETEEALVDETSPGLPVPAGEIILSGTALERVELLNRKHAVIGNYGGKCLVLGWEKWPVDETVLIPAYQRFEDFRNRYSNWTAEKQSDEGTKKVPLGKYWLSHPKRHTYDGVVFEPGAGAVVSGNRLNLWRGFAVEPKRGSWKLLRNHIYRVLGAGDRQAGRYIIRWLAWTLQNPGRAAEAVLVFQGGEGAGKGTLARAMLKIFGAGGLPISDPNHLTGAFTGHLHHCVFMFLDEAFWAGSQQAASKLKSYVTEGTITIRPMYAGPFVVKNLLHIMMASNSDWVVPADHGARRYAVFKVSNARVGNLDYFAAMYAELEAGGIEGMLYDLLRLRLGGWHPKEIYKTAALVEQKQHSLRGLDAWIEGMLQNGALPVPYSAKYPNRCLTMHLAAAAKEFDRYTNESLIAKKLQSLFSVTEFNNKVRRGWVFPELAECRRLWELRNGGSWPWHYVEDEPGVPAKWRTFGD